MYDVCIHEYARACMCVCVCVHLEGFHDRVQIGYPPGRSIFTFSSPFYNNIHIHSNMHMYMCVKVIH